MWIGLIICENCKAIMGFAPENRCPGCGGRLIWLKSPKDIIKDFGEFKLSAPGKPGTISKYKKSDLVR